MKYKARFYYNPKSPGGSIYVTAQLPDCSIQYVTIGVDGEIVYHKHEEGADDMKPFVKITEMDYDLIVEALTDCLSGLGKKTDNDHRIEGTLSATRDHLDDLQKLLKLK